MAALATTLTEFADNGDSRTYYTSGHTASKPKLVLNKRKVPVGNQTVAEFSASVIHATEDPDGAVLPQKVSMQAVVRYPIDGDSADIAAVLAIFQDVVQSDEFASSVTTTGWMV